MTINTSILRFLSIVIIVFSNSINAQRLKADKILKLAQEETPNAIYALQDFVAVSNVSTEMGQLEQNFEYSKTLVESLGFKTKPIETKGAPVLLATKTVDTSLPTVLFYLYVNGHEREHKQWNQKDPYTLELKQQLPDGHWKTLPFENSSMPHNDWRLFGQSVANSKGPALALLTALKLYQKNKWKTAYNIKLLLDFQEKLGASSREQLVLNNKEILKSDYLIILDGIRDISNKPTISFGARGIVNATLTVYGPLESLDAGRYGNYVPNPVFKSSRLLASMKDESGMVVIKDFYKGIILNDLINAELANASMDPIELNKHLGIALEELVSNSYQGSLQYPSLNINKLQAGWTEKHAQTIIPDQVDIELDIRTVVESQPKHLIEVLRNHIIDQGFELIDGIPSKEDRALFEQMASLTYTIDSKPFRTSLSSTIRTLIDDSHQPLFGDQYVLVRTSGGSQPIASLITNLGIDAVSIQIPNPDSNIHTPNENLRIGNFIEGIASCISLLQTPIQ